MTRAKIGAAIAALLLGLFAYFLMMSPSKTSLDIMLRCGADIQGQFNLKLAGGPAKSFDAAERCRELSVTHADYEAGVPVTFTFKNSDNIETALNLEELGAISWGNDGSYYVVVNVTSAPPYLAIGAI